MWIDTAVVEVLMNLSAEAVPQVLEYMTVEAPVGVVLNLQAVVEAVGEVVLNL
jgi:hypothetical protein